MCHCSGFSYLIVLTSGFGRGGSGFSACLSPLPVLLFISVKSMFRDFMITFVNTFCLSLGQVFWLHFLFEYDPFLYILFTFPFLSNLKFFFFPWRLFLCLLGFHSISSCIFPHLPMFCKMSSKVQLCIWLACHRNLVSFLLLLSWRHLTWAAASLSLPFLACFTC